MTSLSKTHRLTSPEVKLVFVGGKREKSGGLTLYYRKNGKDISRFAVVISSKVAKKSVLRNRLRRQTKDVFHRFVSSIKKGYDIIIVFHTAFADRKSIQGAVVNALQRGLLDGPLPQ